MKCWEVFRFEVVDQSRRIRTWLFFVMMAGVAFLLSAESLVQNARSGGYFFNGPFAIASITVFGSLLGLLVPAVLAGHTATRDVTSRIHPIFYTTPIGKAAYLGGRFLAAFILTALIMVSVPVGFQLVTLLPGLEPELIGPFRWDGHVTSYLYFTLPNAFIATALLFSGAVLFRLPLVSYIGGIFLYAGTMLCWLFMAEQKDMWELATLLDPLGLTVVAELSKAWIPAEKSTLLIGLEGSLLSNRILWMSISLGVLAYTFLRFCFVHLTAKTWRWSPRKRRDELGQESNRSEPVTVPKVVQSFDYEAGVRQMAAIALESFRFVVTSWGGLVLAALAVIMVLSGPGWMQHIGVPLLPTTARIVGFLGNSQDLIFVVVPLLTVFYAGELIWRERDAGLGEIVDAAPVPDWVPLSGKFIGFALVLIALQTLMMVASMIIQMYMGYYNFEIGLYVKVLFGIQLVDYLLFALLAFVVHVLVNGKYTGHIVAILAFVFMTLAPEFGIGHNLLVYGSDPGWTYSDMRGFGPYLIPVIWFKLYWVGWALLLAVAAGLFRARGTEQGLRSRIRLAHGRFSETTAWTIASASGLILILGGFIFYNTNVLNEYLDASDRAEWRAEYERRYGHFEGIPQPRMTGNSLNIEIYPEKRTAEIRATYQLVNTTNAVIDSIHLATDSDVLTGAIAFDRKATSVLKDVEFGHHIYVLDKPLHPGDSLQLSFGVHYEPRGFPNSNIDASVAANGTFFEPKGWMPAIGYQRNRELSNPGDRRAHDLPPRLTIPSLYDEEARYDLMGEGRIAFEAVVSTDEEQTALAPGRLVKTWTKEGRRYFHYVTDAPIRNDYAIFSAAYEVYEGQWEDPSADSGQGVEIQIFHHPGHDQIPDLMLRSVRASLDYFRKAFGPYPYGQIRFVEHPGRGISLHAYPINISYTETFALFNPDNNQHFIFPFAVVAHEVAHQWWGNQISPAYVEGAPMLTESLAWYSAMAVVEETWGRDQLRKLLTTMREAYQSPRPQAGVPILRSYDWFQGYRKGPFVMHALSEYVGREQINSALQNLLREYGSGEPPLPTSLDLFRELQVATPDSLQYLLTDLFEQNTYWELETDQALVDSVAGEEWRVTMKVKAQKFTVDTLGIRTDVSMDDWVEIGIFGSSDNGDDQRKPLYLRKHRINSADQTITLIVPRKPVRAGIDPNHLLIDLEPDNNTVNIEHRKTARSSDTETEPKQEIVL